MAFNAFIKFEPEVKGEAKDTGFEGWIEILSFSWGGSNPTTVGGSSYGSSGGKVSLSDFSIMKKADLASGPLFQMCCKGEHFDKASVTLCKQSGGDEPLKYLEMAFEEVYISSLQWSGSSGGEDVPTESISFSYGKVVFTYKQQTSKGTEGATSGGGWDVRTNAAAK